MTLPLELIALCVSAAVLALIAFAIAFYLRPLTITVWSRRNGLRRAKLHKSTVNTSVGRQTVWHGGAGPLLVLLHGAGDQAGTWHKVVPELNSRFQLVIPDLAGHAESEPRNGALSLGTLLTALERVLDSPPWRKEPLLLAGNSLGAWMAMLYAEKHADRVARVVLIDGGPIEGVAEIGLMPKNREEARRTFAAVLDSSSPQPPGFVLDDVIRVSNTGPISRLIAAGPDDMSKYLLDGKLATFSTPVALIWGASDRLVPLDYAQNLQSQLPNCTLTVIDRCGHAPQLERPHEFTRVLLHALHAGAPDKSAGEPTVPTNMKTESKS